MMGICVLKKRKWVVWACALFLLICFNQQIFAQESKPVLKLAIIPHRSNLGNEQAYGVFIRYLERETGIEFEWVGSKTYADIIEKLKSKKAHVGYLGPFSYVEANDDFGLRLICRTLSKKSVEFYHSMIIARKDSGFNTLQDLKGKRFAFTDPKSTSGFLFPKARLVKAGIRLDDFSEVQYVKRHANSLLAVYYGHVHAGATSYTARDKVDVNFDEIQILWKSDPIYRGPWVTIKDLPDDQFYRIQKAFLEINQHKDAGEIFADLVTKGFVKAQDSDYNNIRETIRFIEK